MTTVGVGVREIRLRDDSGVYRIVFVTKLAERIFVPDCLQKKTQKTSRADIGLASRRYKELVKEYS